MYVPRALVCACVCVRTCPRALNSRPWSTSNQSGFSPLLPEWIASRSATQLCVYVPAHLCGGTPEARCAAGPGARDAVRSPQTTAACTDRAATSPARGVGARGRRGLEGWAAALHTHTHTQTHTHSRRPRSARVVPQTINTKFGHSISRKEKKQVSYNQKKAIA